MVRRRARAVLRPRPDEVPVTTTSFLPPNLASMRLVCPRRAGICKLRPAAGATAAASARRSLMLESGLRRRWWRVAVCAPGA